MLEKAGCSKIFTDTVSVAQSDRKDLQRVMPLATKETKGRADGARVQQIVRELTA